MGLVRGPDRGLCVGLEGRVGAFDMARVAWPGV